MPPQLNLSSEKLERNGVFLLEDGQTIYLYFGREVAPEIVNAILGIPSLEGLDTTQVSAIYRTVELIYIDCSSFIGE